MPARYVLVIASAMIALLPVQGAGKGATFGSSCRAQERRQLGDIGRNPPRLVAGQQFG